MTPDVKSGIIHAREILRDTMKPVRWVGSSKKDLKEFPEEVQDVVGQALTEAQWGRTAPSAKPYTVEKGSGTGVMEIVEDYNTDTYRAVYTVRFKDVIYVLHCFQKKSKKGIATPRPDQELIKARLKAAEADFRQRGG